MHNILSLDGGGTRGVFSVQILTQMEKLLRQKYGRDDLVLADHFDFIAGPAPVPLSRRSFPGAPRWKTVEGFYLNQSRKVFGQKTWFNRFRFKFHAHELNQLLRTQFSEDDGEPAFLGTAKLKTLFPLRHAQPHHRRTVGHQQQQVRQV